MLLEPAPETRPFHTLSKEKGSLLRKLTKQSTLDDRTVPCHNGSSNMYTILTILIFILKADLGPQIDFGLFGTFFSTGFGVRPIWFVPLLLLMKA